MTVFDLLRRDEGTVDHVYFLNGIPHCGTGHNLVTGPRLSMTAMEMILKDDVGFFVTKLKTDVDGWDALDTVRQAVLISIAYQCGMSGMLGFFHMLQAIAMGDFKVAARELRNSKLATQNVERTARLAAMLETGDWPTH